MAYQIAFDLYESATQHFLARVMSLLRVSQAAFLPVVVEATAGESESAENKTPKSKFKFCDIFCEFCN